MSNASIALSTGLQNVELEEQATSSTVQGRRGLPVQAGTAENQVTPIPTNTTTILKDIIGILQEDANDEESSRMIIAGQVGWARVKGTPSRGDHLIAKTGSATDAENGSLEVQATLVNDDLVVAIALEDGTDQSYIKVVCVMQRLPAS